MSTYVAFLRREGYRRIQRSAIISDDNIPKNGWNIFILFQ